MGRAGTALLVPHKTGDDGTQEGKKTVWLGSQWVGRWKYLFQKYITTGKTDMMAPWKMVLSRWPSVMAEKMMSF